MLPEAAIISRPSGRVFLNSRVARTSQYKWSATRQLLLQSLLSCHGHKHAVQIMQFPMCFRITVITMDNIKIHRFRCIKHSWFIHIIPYAVDSKLCIILMLLSPPLTNLFFCKVRKCACSRPYISKKQIAFKLFAEIIIQYPSLILLIIRVLLNSRRSEEYTSEL